MKAAVYYETGSPSVFKYKDIPDPQCGPNDILIETKAISVEWGDLNHRSIGEISSKPHCVGYLAAGEIVETGKNVTGRKCGQRVVTLDFLGSYAKKRVTPALTSWLIPDNLSYEKAVCIPVAFGTAHDCLFEFGRLEKGETVLIHGGAGGVGIAAIQMAKKAGAQVLATSSKNDRLERLKNFGLDEGINYREKDFEDEVNRLTDNRGVNLVIDSVGGKTLYKSINCLCHRGRGIVMGNTSREVCKLDIHSLQPFNKSIIGYFQGSEIRTDRVQKLITDIMQEAEQEKIRVVIDRHFPLSKAADAHDYIENQGVFGRVLLIP